MVGELERVFPLCVDDEQFGVAGAVRDEGYPAAVGRPRGRPAIGVERGGEREDSERIGINPVDTASDGTKRFEGERPAVGTPHRIPIRRRVVAQIACGVLWGKQEDVPFSLTEMGEMTSPFSATHCRTRCRDSGYYSSM